MLPPHPPEYRDRILSALKFFCIGALRKHKACFPAKVFCICSAGRANIKAKTVFFAKP